MYIGKLSSNVTCASLRKHLQEVGITGISDVINLNCHIPDQASFCVVADGEANERTLYNSALWPRGAKIRPYTEKRKNASRTPGNSTHARNQKTSRNGQSGTQQKHKWAGVQKSESATHITTGAGPSVPVSHWATQHTAAAPLPVHCGVNSMQAAPAQFHPSPYAQHGFFPTPVTPPHLQSQYAMQNQHLHQNRFSPLADPRYSPWVHAIHV